MRRRIGVVTVGRSDYTIYYPLLRAIQSDSSCELCLIAASAHLSNLFGYTASEIESDGFHINERVHMLLSSDTPEAVAISIGIGVVNFTHAYQNTRPDLVVLLGDRFDMLAAAISALPLRIPVAHLHGGELTLGAMDDAIRHAISKLSHLHFVSTAIYGRRLEQMGEEPHRVFVTGSPVVDAVMRESPVPRDELEVELGFKLEHALLITYHPVSLENERTEASIEKLLEALGALDSELIFTYPNADMKNAAVISRIGSFAASNPKAHVFVNLGRRRYLSLQRYVAAMVGNSSSGLIEAASVRVPVVNVGSRQAGRMRTPNVIDVEDDSAAIRGAIQRAISPAFRAQFADMQSPYGDGNASSRILQVLKTVPLGEDLLKKKFRDLSLAEQVLQHGVSPGSTVD